MPQAELNARMAFAAPLLLGAEHRATSDDEISRRWLTRLDDLNAQGLLKPCHHLAMHEAGTVPGFIYIGEPENAICTPCMKAALPRYGAAYPDRCDGCQQDQPPGAHFTEITLMTSIALVSGHVCDACRLLAGLDPR